MRRTPGWAMGAVLVVGLVGCTAPGDEVAEQAASTEPAAAAAPVATPAVPALPDPVVVSDDPPRELRFSSGLTGRQRNLVNAELATELAGGRGPTTPTAAEFDLNGDGSNEVFVMLKANAWCGSGDVCNIWLFEQQGDSWRWLSDGTDAGSCLSVLPTATNGWRDIRLHGQCRIDMCTFDLRYDGTRYTWDGNRDCDPIPELN
ncbi:MAG: hypothetical protein R3F55_10415 [Alphaproteobacteria bacterium]